MDKWRAFLVAALAAAVAVADGLGDLTLDEPDEAGGPGAVPAGRPLHRNDCIAIFGDLVVVGYELHTLGQGLGKSPRQNVRIKQNLHLKPR
jgi:hypothetical protein